jgi:hypothetical protein
MAQGEALKAADIVGTQVAKSQGMSHHPLSALLAILTLSACDDSSFRSDEDRDAEVGVDEHEGGAQFDAARSPTPNAVLPEDPATFRIELTGTACEGGCPTYSVAMDQDGNVSFVGEACVARPGVFTQKVAAEDARAVYDALLATPYGELRDRYNEPSECPELLVDAPTYSWRVQADGQEKSLVRYAGCDGVPALEEVDAVMRVVHQRSDVARYLYPAAINCMASSSRPFDLELRLSHHVPIGVLKLESTPPAPWSLVLRDCTGRELARGTLWQDPEHWLLIDERQRPISLPGALGEVGSLLLDIEQPDVADALPSVRAVRALYNDRELALEFAAGASCAP